MIAGRRIGMKNYRFELIFDDPATGQVVLVRSLETVPTLANDLPVDGAVFEYMLMWPAAFVTFLERVHDMERHQPALRRRRTGTGAYAQYSGPTPLSGVHGVPGRVRPTSGPGAPVLPEAALNLPGDEDFGLPQADPSEIEVRLGLSSDHVGGLTSTPAAEAPSAPPPQQDLGLSGDLSEGLSADFDWRWSDDADGSGGLGSLDLPEPGGDFMSDQLGAAAASALVTSDEVMPPSSLDLGAAPGWEVGFPSDWSDDAIAAEPLDADDSASSVVTALGAMKAPSLLGPLEADFAALVRKAEQDVRREGHALGSAVASEDAKKERLRVPRPDFHLMFRDYVYFWVGEVGAAESELAIGRKYRDVLFDLHRIEAPKSREDWGPDVAIREFLRRKIRTNFVPQTLNYEALPEGAGELYPLTVERLEAAFDAIT